MGTSGSIQRAGGSGSKVIVHVDFDGSRPGSRVEDLARIFDQEAIFYTCAITDQLSTSISDELAMRSSEWLSELEEHRSQVIAVIGYCAGGHIAEHLARELYLLSGRNVLLVTYDTSPVDTGVILSEFQKYVDRIAGYIESSDMPEKYDSSSSSEDTPRHIVDALVAKYAEVVCAASRSLELGASIQGQMVESFAEYLGYILLAIQAQQGDRYSNRVDIVSKEYFEHGVTDGIVAESAHNDLLTSKESIDILAAALKSVHSPTRRPHNP
ncbi:hypothetical protein AB0346_10720 [Nocardia beijingensis]|uniref:hypothetical protein n=1 Tax=Nocardia beijingensis TaxID=95162 RepID=UPI00344FC0BF